MSIVKKGFFVMAVSALLALGMSSLAYAAEANQITVNGTGVVLVEPDVAKIFVNVETKDKSTDGAQKENNKIVTAVQKEMEKMGVGEDEIVTSYASVYTDYKYDNETGKQTADGYRATTTLQVTVEDVDNVGKYIDGALKAGATGFSNVSFSLADPSKYYNQALQTAVKNASSSATAIAGSYGRTLGEISSVTENSSVAFYEAAGTKEGILRGEADTGVAPRSAPTQIKYDKVEVTARISATYNFK